MSHTSALLVAFAEERLSPREFESLLASDPTFEAVLSNVAPPAYAGSFSSLYHYLISVRLTNPGQALNAIDAIAEHLASNGVKFIASDHARREYELLLDAQPTWLQVDAEYLQSMLSQAPPLSRRADKVQWLRGRIHELFRSVGKPPRWLQAPEWPIEGGGPLVFLGQIAVDNYFHDSGAIYVFHNPETNEIKSILQTR